MQNWIDIKKLDFTEYNPRQVRGDALERLKKSLGSENGKRLFEKRPCLANKRDGRIVVYAGNQRLRAAKELGWDKVPCDIDEISLEEERERNIKDNLVIGEWDDDILANNFDIQELEDWGVDLKELDIIKEPDVEEDDVPEVPDEPRAKRGEIYQLGKHRLMCGDSTSIDDVEKLMDGKKADMVFTDPPYNVDYEGYTEDALKIQSDKMSDEDYCQFLSLVFGCYVKLMKKGASIYVCHADAWQKDTQMVMEAHGLDMRCQIIWAKNTFAWGFGRYKFQHEPIFYAHFKGQSDAWYGDKKQSTLWQVDKPSRNKEHPTMKPVELIQIALKNSSKSDDYVSDLFLGSGSTLIACEQLNRICYGMEIDPKYCDVIIERYCNFTNTDKEEIYGKAEEANRLQSAR